MDSSRHNSKACLLYKVSIYIYIYMYIYVHRHKGIKSSEKGSRVPTQGTGAVLTAEVEPTVEAHGKWWGVAALPPSSHPGPKEGPGRKDN